LAFLFTHVSGLERASISQDDQALCDTYIVAMSHRRIHQKSVNREEFSGLLLGKNRRDVRHHLYNCSTTRSLVLQALNKVILFLKKNSTLVDDLLPHKLDSWHPFSICASQAFACLLLEEEAKRFSSFSGVLPSEHRPNHGDFPCEL